MHTLIYTDPTSHKTALVRAKRHVYAQKLMDANLIPRETVWLTKSLPGFGHGIPATSVMHDTRGSRHVICVALTRRVSQHSLWRVHECMYVCIYMDGMCTGRLHMLQVCFSLKAYALIKLFLLRRMHVRVCNDFKYWTSYMCMCVYSLRMNYKMMILVCFWTPRIHAYKAFIFVLQWSTMYMCVYLCVYNFHLLCFAV
jgi:hypothetical protein